MGGDGRRQGSVTGTPTPLLSTPLLNDTCLRAQSSQPREPRWCPWEPPRAPLLSRVTLLAGQKGWLCTPPPPSRGLGRAAQQCAQDKRRKLEGQKAPSCSSRAPPTGFSRFPRTPDTSWAAFRNQGTGECLLPQAGPATPQTHRDPPISTPHLRPLPSVSPPPRPD